MIRLLKEYRTTALRLGVLLIKLGQFLSSRADLLPEPALEVLGDLQDQVPAAPFNTIRPVVEAELGCAIGDVFSSFKPDACAAASLGQVHRAVLRDTGESVAVKVQRPQIDALVRDDLATLQFVIWVIRRVTKPSSVMDLQGLYREFQRTLFEGSTTRRRRGTRSASATCSRTTRRCGFRACTRW